MLYILPTNPFSIIRVAEDIATVLGGKVIRGFFNPRALSGDVILVGNPDAHARLLYDAVKDNEKIKNIILYLVCEGIFEVNQVNWLWNVKGHIITPSNYVAEKFEDVGVNVTDVIPHGVSHFGNPKEKENIFGYVSGYMKRKYPDYLNPQFYSFIRNIDFRVITTSNNPYAKYFGKVIYGDYKLGYDDIIRFYNSINFYVNLSDAEGFGLTVLEAMAMGSVAIIPNLPVFKEFYPYNLVMYFNITWKRYYEPFSFEHIEHFEYDVNDLLNKMLEALNMDSDTYKILSRYSIEFAKNYSISNTYTKFSKYLSG